MKQEKSSYQQIFKATTLFGGVQIFNIVIAIAKSKVIAVLLGPAGMGISNLLTSSVSMIGNITNLGLSTSAVKNIAEAGETSDGYKISKTVTVLRKWMIITGMLGTVTILLSSSYLSKITFGNYEYTLSFILLSFTLFINQINAGQMVMLQGLRKLKDLAKAGIIGAAIGLITNIPLYYFLGVDGIVPSLILTSVTGFMISYYYSRKHTIKNIRLKVIEIWENGKSMIVMGFLINLTGVLSLGTAYLLKIFMSNRGGIEDVGLYSAGFAIINNYVGLVFNAIVTDYYPRLSSAANDNEKAIKMINEQTEIAILIISPILISFFVFINYLIILLYSSKFIPINEMILWAGVGMYFKTVSWAIAFIFLAKGASKLFFWNEIISNVYSLLLNIAGYVLYGLKGLGISFIITYILYLIQVFFVSKYYYKFLFTNRLVKIFIIQFILGITGFASAILFEGLLHYLLGAFVLILSIIISYKELNKLIDIKNIIISYKNKVTRANAG